LSADTIVPGAGDPQSLNRYSFVRYNPLKYVDPSGHDPCEAYNGSECVVRYFDPESDNAGKYAFNLFENGSLNCAGCMTSSIQAGFEQIRQNQANDHNQAALTIASLVSGGRLVYQGGKWVVAGLQGVYDWLGQQVLGACIRTPICAGPFLRLLERGDSGSKIDGQKIVLGIDKYLDEFADEVGGASWKVWGAGNWQQNFLNLMSNKLNKVYFNLKGVNVTEGIARAEKALEQNIPSGAIDWELLMIRNHPEWWSRITWVNGSNPFK
jgi:hypothetical protein